MQCLCTWQLPWLALVEVDDGDDLELDLEVVDPPLEVVADELVVGGVEPEAGRQSHGAHAGCCCSCETCSQFKYLGQFDPTVTQPKPRRSR